MIRPSLIAFALLVTACGGGSGRDAEMQPIIDRSGFTSGAISGFGSVIVNGITFDSSSATIVIDDMPGQETDLRVGQVVTVRGVVNGVQGTADSISVDPTLRGPVASVDLDAMQLRLLKTSVLIGPDTLLDRNIGVVGLADIAPGDAIEVFGFGDAQGNISASYIRRVDDSQLERQGIVSDLNEGARTFTLGAVLVDYSSAVLEDFEGTPLGNGNFVEVEGQAVDASGTLIADRVELEDDAIFTGSDEGSEISIEGFITEFVSATAFKVNGTAVTTNASTQFEGGSSADLSENQFVEVEGVIGNTGDLTAEEIEFESSSNLEAQAPVESRTETSIRVLGLDLQADTDTQFVDDSDLEIRDFSFSDVNVGDFVKIRAFLADDVAMLNLLKRKSPEDKLKLEGVITAIDDPDLRVLTAVIRTDTDTQFELEDIEVTPAAFFSAIKLGDTVSAQGTSPEDGVLLAEEIEIED